MLKYGLTNKIIFAITTEKDIKRESIEIVGKYYKVWDILQVIMPLSSIITDMYQNIIKT